MTREGEDGAAAMGFDFNADRDGVWTEGTAQAALTFRVTGREAEARGYLATALAARDPQTGWLRATDGSRLSTGLSTGLEGVAFEYAPYLHLGATAWAALAAAGRNPFVPPAAEAARR